MNWPRSARFTIPLLGFIAAVLSGCQSAPDPVLAAKSCAQLAQRDMSEPTSFSAKSPLHRLFLEKYGMAGAQIMLRDVEKPKPQTRQSYGTRVAFYAAKVCVPLHGAKKCQTVAKDYADYEDRANDRSWARRRLKCPTPY